MAAGEILPLKVREETTEDRFPSLLLLSLILSLFYSPYECKSPRGPYELLKILEISDTKRQPLSDAAIRCFFNQTGK